MKHSFRFPTNEAEAIRCYRRALLIALIAPIFEWVRLLSSTSSFRVPAGVGLAFIIAPSIFVLWFFGFRVLMFVSAIFHFAFGGMVSLAEWQKATYRGLWPLPYGCALGVIIWLSYSLGRFGGWPSDVVFGALGNLVGAWLYLTIFRQWFLLRRSSSRDLHETSETA